MHDTAYLAERLTAARHAGSSRTRSPEDVEMLTRMALVEIARRKAEGRLIQIGPREYEVHLRQR